MANFGKGLEALIPKKEGAGGTEAEHKKEAVFSLEIDKIKPNPYQPRREFDEQGLKALADSIRAHGILQPLVVSRKENPETGTAEYQLIAGERRLRAARMAGFSRVPAIVRVPADKEKLELSLMENVQREDLSPLERAEAFSRLQKEFGFSHKEIGRLVGKSRESVSNTIRLLTLPAQVQRALREGHISEGHARAIMMAKTGELQERLLDQIQKERFSVRKAEAAVQKLAVWKPTTKTKAFFAEFRTLEERAKKVLGIPAAKFRMQAGFPQLVIPLRSKKEAEDLIGRIEKS